MIQRWGFYATMDGAKLEQCDDGELVKYDDHEAALAAEKEKVRELVECLSDVVSFIGYGSYVPERVERVEALIEKYKEEPNA